MTKLMVCILSIIFCTLSSWAEIKVVRNAVCHFDNKDYILYTENFVGLVANQPYVIFEKNLLSPEKLPRTLEGSFKEGAKDLELPTFWRPLSIPLSSCRQTEAKIKTFDEVIREFYVKTYLIYGDLRPIMEDIEELVKTGDAIALKLRILCKSDDFTDDLTLCNEITILDKVIPINPNEP